MVGDSPRGSSNLTTLRRQLYNFHHDQDYASVNGLMTKESLFQLQTLLRTKQYAQSTSRAFSSNQDEPNDLLSSKESSPITSRTSSQATEEIKEEDSLLPEFDTLSIDPPSSTPSTISSPEYSDKQSKMPIVPLLPPKPSQPTLDVLFLLYETIQEQVHNRNHISCTRYLKDSIIDISKCNADQVEEILMHFLTTDPHNHKMIMYVGHSRHYCHLECGHDTSLSEERVFQIIEQYTETSQLYLTFLCSSLDYYTEDRMNHKSFLDKLRANLQGKLTSIESDSDRVVNVNVEVLWDRTMQRYPTSFQSRRDFHVYRKVEDEINRYNDVRFYEE